jgi:hypothetical protein
MSTSNTLPEHPENPTAEPVSAVGSLTTSPHEVVEDEKITTPGWTRRHMWPLLGMLVILITGMAFTFWWNLVVHGVNFWSTPPDLWATFRDAHYIVWNGEGHVYNASTSFVTFPGIAVFLAPLAEIQLHFNLSESFPVYLSHPTAWYLLGPVDMLCGGILLFPLDSLARRLSVSAKRRIMLVGLETVIIWPTVALWGHPEDTLALAFAFTGLMAAFDRRWVHAGAFFALAVVFQPLVVLMLPIVLTYVPTKRWPAFAGIVAVPSVLLLLPPLIQEWGPTTFALLKQPNYPAYNHPTPWLALAPVIKKRGYGVTGEFHIITSHGHRILEYGPVKVLEGEIVAAGPGRVIALVLACAIGVWVARKRPSMLEAVWLVAVALSLRCVFECVMDPYYLLPALALALVAGSKVGNVRYGLTVLSAALCTWLSYWRLGVSGEWTYYVLVIGTLLLALAFSWPGADQQSLPEEPNSSGQEPMSLLPEPAKSL